MHPLVALALAFVFCINAGLASWVLLRGDHSQALSLVRVGGSALVVAGTTLLEVLLMLPLGLHPFGIVHIAWIDVAYVIPVTGIGALLAGRAGRPLARGVRVVAWLAVLALPAVAVAHFVEPNRLVVERVDVPLDPARAGTSPLKIGVLADLQTTRVGDHERAAVAALMAGRPDLIVVPGDIYQGTSANLEPHRPDFQALLGQLSAPGGVWVVAGNTDNQDELPSLLVGTSARLLRDEVVRFTLGDRRVALLGFDELSGRRVSFPRSGSQLARFGTRAPDETDEIRIVVAHRPRAVLGLPDPGASAGGVDLVIAGHTHGGQVTLPFVGPPLTLSPLPRAVGAGGLHDVLGNRLYVSRGVGMERGQAPRIRWACPPEVSLLTLGPTPAPR